MNSGLENAFKTTLKTGLGSLEMDRTPQDGLDVLKSCTAMQQGSNIGVAVNLHRGRCLSSFSKRAFKAS